MLITRVIVVSDVEGEGGGDEKHEVVCSSGPMTSSSVVAVEFVITAESLCQLRVVQRDSTTPDCTTAQQQGRHDVSSCVDETTAGVVTTTH